MKKKILSLFMAALMTFLLLPMRAFAAEETVYLSISDDGKFVTSETDGTVMAYIAVPLSEIAKIDLSEYGLERFAVDNDQDGKDDLTVLHLCLYAHEKYYKEGAEPLVSHVSGSPGSIFFEWFFGHDCNLNYYVNGEYPLMYDGWGATADTLVLNPGDFVDIMMFTYWGFLYDSYAGFHNFFDENGIIHEMLAKAGEETEFILKRGYGNMNSGGATEYVTVPNVPVYYSQKGLYDAECYETESDENGNVSITFPEGGTWYVWVDGQPGCESPDNIVSSSAYLKVWAEPSYVLGDIDGNEKITLWDVVLMRRFLLNSEKYPIDNEAAADVDSNGKVTLWDVVLLRRYLLNSEKYPIG